jgi:hypothetical protein
MGQHPKVHPPALQCVLFYPAPSECACPRARHARAAILVLNLFFCTCLSDATTCVQNRECALLGARPQIMARELRQSSLAWVVGQPRTRKATLVSYNGLARHSSRLAPASPTLYFSSSSRPLLSPSPLPLPFLLLAFPSRNRNRKRESHTQRQRQREQRGVDSHIMFEFSL